jgi:predicted dehydrogenase
MSFDVWNHELPHMELYGTKGTLIVADPDRYDDAVRYRMHADDARGTPPSRSSGR